MRYASVCSGVEAASLAWECLGWEPAWFSEIEAFPCAVLKTRFPHVPNLGDMTKIEGEKYRGTVDLLVGGTPCQDVSVAGKRKGFAGERSGLAFAYIRLLETMRPRWFVWENVPGVLSSSGGEDFKAFIRSADEVGYSCAWRVLDAQYVRVDGFPRAVPQRRRRVFVVGHSSGDWRYPASVLFEPDCLPRDTPPRRTKRQDAAAGADAGVDPAKWGDGGDRADTLTCTSHNQLMPDKARLQCVLDMRQIEARGDEVSPTLISTDYKGGKAVCFENHGQDSRVKEIEIAPVLSAKSGTGENCAVNLTCNHEAPIIGAFMPGQGAKAGSIAWSEEHYPALRAGDSGTNRVPAVVCLNDQGGSVMRIEKEGAIGTLRANTHGNNPIICVHGSQDPITNTDHANAVNRNNGLENCVCQYGDIAGTLETRHDSSPCADRGMNIVYENHMQDSRVKECGQCSPQINAAAGTGGGNLPLVQSIAIAENIIGRQVENGGNGTGAQEELSYTLNATGVMGVSQNETVRRLTPVECERLMGFPDNWTRIPWKLYQECVRKGWSFESEMEKRGKKLKTTVDDCPDSPRYKACGNSMCVNVMRWIGMRIELVERKIKEIEIQPEEEAK